jgi:ABC-2 type transport system ATP-binding protein
MNTKTVVEVEHINKQYGKKTVVNDISFSVMSGEIFGLIGPNGAGKTTTIRMMMDIIKPDSGQINILGERLNNSSNNKVGYMPEERGLYRKLRVIDSIIYLASLKGLDKQTAEQRATDLLKTTGMLQHKNKKIEELSKGMGQLIQFIVTIVHNPDLVILDEPFSGLDPVNTELLKSMFTDLRNQGKAVILSTHRMNEIEALCDRILMVNDGRSVLYGNLAEIKSKYRSNSVILECDGDINNLDGVTQYLPNKGKVQLLLNDDMTPQKILEQLVNRGLKVNHFEVATPPLNEIFIKIVGKKNE